MIGHDPQRPPAYSAIKVGGRRAYAMARAGETVVLAEREVTIHELDLLVVGRLGPGPARSRSSTSTCSAGTYVRALARDLGEALGSAAYLGALTRTASGPFDARGRRRRSTTIRAAAADGPDGPRAAPAPDRRRPRCLPGGRA